MDDNRLRGALEGLVPTPEATKGWDDVLERAQRKRGRRRRGHAALLTVAAAAAVLVAALAAGAQIGLPITHSHRPHLLLRGALTAPDGTGAGTVELEVQRAMIAFGRRVFVEPFPAPQSRPGSTATLSVRWFLNLRERGGLANASLSMRRRGDGKETLSTLCGPCESRESGRLELPVAQASALFNDELRFALVRHGQRLASGSVAVVRSHLRRGLACWGNPATRLHCRRIYTGRP